MTRTPLALLAVLTASAVATAQPPGPPGEPLPSVPADGTEVFRYLLHTRGVKPVTNTELMNRMGFINDGDLIVISLGTDRSVRGRSAASWAESALRTGGAALVATDQPFNFCAYFPRACGDGGGMVNGSEVFSTAPQEVYDGRTACPFARPFPRPPGVRSPEWGLFDGLTRVATNRPSLIDLPVRLGEFRSVLAGFPPGGRYRVSQFNQPLPLLPRNNVLAAGGSGRHPDTGVPFRFLALADPSVFVNEMMVQLRPDVPPPDNLEFADRVAGYLVEEPGRPPRSRCLFIQNGVVVEKFDTLPAMLRPPRPPLPLPNIDAMRDKIIDGGNGILDKVQENDLLNKLLVGTGDEESQTARLRWIAERVGVLAAVWAAIFLLRKVWVARRPADGPPPPADGLPVAKPGRKADNLFDRRQKELLRRNDVSEPVRAAVRALFRAAGVPADAGPKLPKVRVSDAVRRPETLKQALADLWKVGFGRPAPLPARRWAELEPLLARADKARTDGKWWFVDYVSDATPGADPGPAGEGDEG